LDFPIIVGLGGMEGILDCLLADLLKTEDIHCNEVDLMNTGRIFDNGLLGLALGENKSACKLANFEKAEIRPTL
jgi:2-hydroxy-3-keto-5-methylthiopentenyl-1-phosphate phosphatase